MFAFITHGLFSGTAREKIEKSPLEQILVTNTIPLKTRKGRISK